MTARVIVLGAALAALATAAHKPKNVPAPAPAAPAPAPPFNVVEATIPQMREALEHGRVTSRQLVTQYLVRLALYEDKLHAAITVNSKALEEADALDRERAQHKLRGPLHGIPVAVKDNIQTTNMPTTGGALAFDGLVPPYEATMVKNLRDSGAIIIAKTGMTELANWVAGAPLLAPIMAKLTVQRPFSGMGERLTVATLLVAEPLALASTSR